MSSEADLEIARIKQQIQETLERTEQAERQTQEARERTERLNQEERERTEQAERQSQEARERTEQLIREERERTEQARKETRQTTFEEYIGACHTFLSKPIRLPANKLYGTQGLTTNSENKPCPTLLKPWTDFPMLQQQLFERVYEHLPRDAELFGSVHFLIRFGRYVCDRPVASERDLEIYQGWAVEQPTTRIISCLQQIEKAREDLNLGSGIVFENYANNLSDNNEEIQAVLHASPNPSPPYADLTYVYKKANDTRSLCTVGEYKPVHKLSVFHLRAGFLRADEGSLNIPEDVINRITIPIDAEDKFVYHSEQLIAAALTQIYAYMIENGLEYGKLIAAAADVFLQVKEHEPHTLYYHLAEPNIEGDFALCRTSISQTLTFCLMALYSKPRSQKWRINTLDTAQRAEIDYETIVRQIAAVEKTLTLPPSVFHARIHPVKPQNANDSRNPTDVVVQKDPQGPSGSFDEVPDIETPSKNGVCAQQSGTGQVPSVKLSQAAEESHVRHQQYCTQACLLGLIRKHPLDDNCPNINEHRARGAGNHHALGQKSLAKLMLRQITENPDRCEPLGMQGARGALFRLTLESHGYTFVAKGTVTAFIADLKHEGLVYRHLDKVQGELIPVYLGNISLARPYFLDVGVRIVHMLLMSYSGEQACKDLMLTMGQDLVVEMHKAAAKMLDCGVEHRDVRPPNVLWNPEIGNVMLVDFERSAILKQVPVLEETLPKRKRKQLH